MQTAVHQSAGEMQRHIVRPKHVLCYGHDDVLLQSRKRILELAGCPTKTIQDFSGFHDSLGTGCPGVLILCQTLSLEEGLRAASVALEQCPSVPLLLMYIQRQKFVPAQTHRFMQCIEGPRAFAALVFWMLYHSGDGHPERCWTEHRLQNER